MINFLCPVGGISAWDDNELRYMLRSLDTNCKVPFKVTVLSDHKISWLKGVDFRLTERQPSRPYENFYDTLSKLEHYIKEILKEGDFIYIYDDVCLLQPTTDFSILNGVALQKERLNQFKARENTKHGRTIVEALKLIKDIKPDLRTTYNYETHIPRVYNCERAKHIFSIYDPLNSPIPPAFATLYGNHFNNPPQMVIREIENYIRTSLCFEDDYKTGCYIPTTIKEIETYCEGVMWLHYNDRGLNFSPKREPILKQFISDRFPESSRFEKVAKKEKTTTKSSWFYDNESSMVRRTNDDLREEYNQAAIAFFEAVRSHYVTPDQA